MNTIANWSDADICRMDRTPYMVAIHPGGPEIWRGAWDVYHADWEKGFETAIRDTTRQYGDDTWLIGYFVDNERGWTNDPAGFMATVLASPVSATTKAFVAFLREKADSIQAFNAKAGRTFASWDALEESTDRIDFSGVKPWAEAFYEAYCEKYFAVCQKYLRAYAPNHLYLGCRIHVSNAPLVCAAARHCDVLSFNLYQTDVSGFNPYGQDKPVLVTEFHFGALDRGSLATGLQPASDQEDRAAKYAAFVRGAVKNPCIVGTHWFAYYPQALTGRGDGENYQDGLFDITNAPYLELRAAVPEAGYAMYADR